MEILPSARATHSPATHQPLTDPCLIWRCDVLRWPRIGVASSSRRAQKGTVGERVPRQESTFNMPKRKAKELGPTTEGPRRSSRRISSANGSPALTPSKPAPTPKKPKRTEQSIKDEKTIVNSKQEEDSEAVSFCFGHVPSFLRFQCSISTWRVRAGHV